MRIEGLYTALITPFQKGKIDEKGFCKLIDRQVEAGVDGIVVLSTTAETPTLTEQEQEHLIKLAIKQIKGRSGIIVGTGCYSTAATIEMTRKAKKLGADAALIITPYYNKPTQKGLFLHFEAISNAVDLPIIVYNNPARTGINTEVLTLCEIATLRNIVSVKETSPSIRHIGDVIHHLVSKESSFTVLSGDDDITLPVMALGGHGAISVLSNLLPEKMTDLVAAMRTHDLITARKLHEELLPLIKGINFETNPMGIKEAMNWCGLPAGECRLPLSPMGKNHAEALHRLLKDAGLGTKRKK